jgi:hypothetical protein
MVQFINRNKCFVKSSDIKTRGSNVCLMDGGNLLVPLGVYEEFMTILHANKGKEQWYIVEKVLPLTRLFFDLDFHTGQCVDKEQMDKVLVTMGAEIKKLYPTVDDVQCVVSSCTPYEKAGKLKCGYHIIFPGLVVTVETARKSRAVLVLVLDDAYKGFAGISTWGDVIDAAVQHGGKGGLRMLYTGKSVSCTKDRTCRSYASRKKRVDLCVACSNTGHVDVTKCTLYMAESVVNASKGTASLEKHQGADSRFSIYTFGENETSGFKVGSHVNASVTEIIDSEKKTTPRKRTKQGKIGATAAKYMQSTSGKYRITKQIPPTDEVVQVLEDFIHGVKCGGAQRWKHVIVSHVKLFETSSPKDINDLVLSHVKNPPWFAVHVCGDGASWCPNKRDHHTTNTTWWLFCASGYSIRCFSGKLVVRKGGKTCPNFATAMHKPPAYMTLWEKLAKHCYVHTQETPDEFILSSDDDNDPPPASKQKINFLTLLGGY